jgi:deazaflavin-dependent oxidoreductase (nitroreductase family)
MSEEHDFNQSIIYEFRANDGVVGGPFEGAPMVLLTTTGAKSGRPHTTPVVYLRLGDHVYVFGSKAGAPTHPAWYHNLVANPRVTVELGDVTYEAEAEVLAGDQRDRVFDEQVTRMPGFADYQQNTTRVIPVIMLDRLA